MRHLQEFKFKRYSQVSIIRPG